MKQILVVGNFYESVLVDLRQTFDVRHVADKDDLNGWSEADYADIEGMATFGWAPARLMDRMPRLKLVSSFGVGYDGIAADHAARKGIVVTHTPNVLNDDVANTAIALILAVTRRIVAQDKYLRAGKWVSEGNAPLTRTIRGKTVGIVGLGRIGETIAHKLSVFQCRVVYHSRTEKDVEYDYFADLKEMAQACDILVVITPGGPETEKLIDRSIIDALGPEGTLVNVARGTVVDEPEMVKALQDGRLGAAALDVFADEPNVPEALFALDNVVLTPHVASATVETRQAMADLVVENIVAFFDGRTPPAPVPECADMVG